MTPEELKKAEEECREDLREIASFYGGWDKLKKVIDQLEDNDNEAVDMMAADKYEIAERQDWIQKNLK